MRASAEVASGLVVWFFGGGIYDMSSSGVRNRVSAFTWCLDVLFCSVLFCFASDTLL